MSTGSEDRFPLTVGEDTGDAIDVSLSPETTPGVYERRVACLMQSGLSEDEARRAAATPLTLELFYGIGQGLFAVEYEPLDSIRVYNPYDGTEVPNENLIYNR